MCLFNYIFKRIYGGLEMAKDLKTKVLSFFQELGKTFMFPVATLAFMGILLGLGSSITSPILIEKNTFFGE